MDYRLAAGDLDRRVDIMRAGPPVHDGYQNRPGPLAVLATVWAKYRPTPGQERWSADQNGATAPVVFTIRWSSGVADVGPADSIRYPKGETGRLYDIKSATELGRRVAIEIVAIGRVR